MWVEFDNQNVDTKYCYIDILVCSKVIKAHICAHLLRQHRSPRWCERYKPKPESVLTLAL